MARASDPRTPQEPTGVGTATLGVVWLLLAGCVGVLLFLLFGTSVIFGSKPVVAFRGLILALAVSWLVTTLSLLSRLRGRTTTARAETSLVAWISIAGAMWAGLAVLAPLSPPQASAPACRGVPISGGSITLVSPETGINLRQGPDVTSAQVGRLPAGCSFAVDGFCLGADPLSDVTYPELRDNRWFLLHRVRDGWREGVARRVSGGSSIDQFVAAAKIPDLVSSDALPRLDAETCGPRSAAIEPGAPRLTVLTSKAAPIQQFRITAVDTFEFGVAIFVDGDLAAGQPYRKLVSWNRPEGNEVVLDAAWDPRLTARYLPRRTDVVVYGARCYAIGSPIPTEQEEAAFLRYRLALDGQLQPIPKGTLSVEQTERLGATACRVDRP